MKFLLGIILYLILFSGPIYADSKFTTTYDLTYKVEESGITTVTQNFQIKNNTSEFLPQQYITTIGKQELVNFQAFDKTGKLDVKLDGSGDNRTLIVKFRQSGAGLGQSLNWTLTYQTNEIAKRHGQIWEIYIQKPEDKTEVQSYTIGLYVPNSLGKPFITKPVPKSSDHIWTNTEIEGKGIYASYFLGQGNNPFQIFDFKLTYHLHNSKLYPAETEFALPGDKSYQKIFLQSLTPLPVNVYIDRDNNWIAKYSLGPAGNIDVIATGSAIVYFRPTPEKDSFVPTLDYVKWQRYWETTDPRIISMVKKTSTPKEIYDLVLKTLKYDPQRAAKNISRLGASGILNNPNSAISLEFTDLFIALTRASDIPSREINGIVFPHLNLHSWPEYYDKTTRTWKMIDPTLGSTTGLDYFNDLDLNHMALVTRGQNSSSPLSVGTYKVNDDNSNDIQVTYSSRVPDRKEKISIRTNLPPKITSGLPFSGKVYIDNNGSTIFGQNKLEIQTGKLNIGNDRVTTPEIPPFGHVEISFTIDQIPWAEDASDIITIKFAGLTKDYKIDIQPIFTNKYLFVIGGLTILGLISIIAQITRGIFFQKQKR